MSRRERLLGALTAPDLGQEDTPMVKKAAQAIPSRAVTPGTPGARIDAEGRRSAHGAPHGLMVTLERGTAFPSAYYVERVCKLLSCGPATWA